MTNEPKELDLTAEKTPNALDGLTWMALNFLLERTDWSEPYLGFGFATEFHAQVQAACNRKAVAIAERKRAELREQGKSDAFIDNWLKQLNRGEP